MIRLVEPEDYGTWLDMAREVEDLFGPMADVREFQEGIGHCIDSGCAYCMTGDQGDVMGILALDRGNNEIAWLAVRKECRGNRVGEKLVRKAVEEMGETGDIFVQTFAPSIEAGKPARHIYEKCGFADLKEAGKNPAGLDTVIMVRKP